MFKRHFRFYRTAIYEAASMVLRLTQISRLFLLSVTSIALFEKRNIAFGFHGIQSLLRTKRNISTFRGRQMSTYSSRNMKTEDDLESVSSTRSFSEEFAESTGRQTSELLARRAIEYAKKDHSDRSLCSHCFLTKQFCLCDYVNQLYVPIRQLPSSSFPVKVHLLMHYKEWGRASNTGKLLTIGLPNCASIKIYGIVEDEERLIEELTTNPSIILYPTKQSQSITNFLPTFQAIQAEHASMEREKKVGESTDKPCFHICVIDSTWGQSKAMERSLPDHLPRVHISDFVSQPSKFLNRKQSQNKSKISTIESVVMAFQALQISSEITDLCHKSLEYSVDSLFRQNGKVPAYGNSIQPKFYEDDDVSSQVSANSTEQPRLRYFKPKVVKPEKCLHCGSKITEVSKAVNFKNCGVRTRIRDLSNLTPEIEQERIETVQKILEEARNQTNEIMRINPHLTIPEREENLELMKNIMLSAPTYRVWNCSECKLYFPSIDHNDYS